MVATSQQENDEIWFETSRQIAESTSDDVIAAELSKLSIVEREAALHDLHGVSSGVVETPELVEQSSLQMDDLLYSRTVQKSKAYELAEKMNPVFVQDIKFRLLFLRAEEFNVQSATAKMQQFLNMKCELFGSDKLCKSITLHDLSHDDMETLHNGHFQLLNRRDRAGRAVICISSRHIRYPSLENELRQIYYFFTSLLEDEETQKNGFIMVPFGMASHVSPRGVFKVNQLIAALPIKIQGFHVIRPVFGGFLNWTSSILEKRARVRIRCHMGKHMEVMYSLMTFGIPTSDFPIVDDEETLVRTQHLRWIENRRRLERQRGSPGMDDPPSDDASTSASAASVYLPTSNDILFGRGRPFQQHPGNLRFSLVIESLKPQYEELKRNEKTTMAENVVKQLKDGGSRFLRQGEGCWEEVDDAVAREKVSQAFRSLRSGKVGSSSSTHSRKRSVQS
eukprot:Nitzschia sp. Nitz4//scaffold99_size76975//4803//6306//NITZ4_005564-RA/size76975-snap-gene-0.4-mRNA-1//-1//CDS//3329560814//6276//frame0